MDGMFSWCEDLKILDLSSFNTQNVTIMFAMFSYCYDLTTIYAGSGWTTIAETTNGGDMFAACPSLVGGRGTAHDDSHTDATYARIDMAPDAPGYFTRTVVMGDANDDGSVTIADAVATVTNILNEATNEYFSQTKADMNGDSTIDIFDVTLIVSAVFNAASPAPAYSRAGGVAAEDVQLTAQGNRVMMGIEKEGQYTAFQFDVTLPEGTELEGVSLASASTNHQLSFQKRQGNTYRVIGLSMTNEQLAAANGRLVQLQLSDNAGEKNVKMSNVIFVGQPATDATAIRNYVSDGAADRDAIYDLNGRYVGTDKSRLTKGIYIINHKKVNIK
jgi:surface protein